MLPLDLPRLRLTHTELHPDSVFLSDVDENDQSQEFQQYRQQVYVPFGETIELVLTDGVINSYNKGAIRGFIERGYLTGIIDLAAPGGGDMLKAVYDPTGVAGDAFDADNQAYDPAISGLVATDVQAAIDEVDGKVDALEAGSHDPVTLDAGSTTQEAATLAGQELELLLATTITDGVMSSTDKTKLDGITTGATVGIDAEDEGAPVAGGPFTTLNFVGPGVVATDAGSGELTVSVSGGGGGGDMLAATYDPGGVAGDAFDSANHAYDNATSGLTATDVQSAIDEVEGRVDTLEGDSHVAVTLEAGAVTQDSANLIGQEFELVLATVTTAGVMSGADKAKLDGVTAGANNYVHPNHTGDVTSAGDGAQIISVDVVDNTKLSNMPALTLKGNDTGGIADPQDLTVAKVQTLLNIEDGATNTPLTASAPEDVDKTVAAVGVSVDAARADHKHDVATATAVELTDSTNAEGVSTSLSRADHTHAHGDRGGGTLHSDFVGDAGAGGTAGFVPAPAIGDAGRFLMGDGTWASIPGGGDMLAATYDPGGVVGDAFDADNQVYDNATSGLAATDVQAAIDEVEDRVDTLEGDSHVAVTLDVGAVTQDTANLVGQDLEFALATTTTAGVMSSTDKTKLDGISAGANNYTHPNHTGDVTSVGDGPTTIVADVVDNTKLSNMPALTIKGNDSGGSTDPQDLTVAEVQTLLNIADGATEGVGAEDEGSTIAGGPFTVLNFVGAGVTASDGGSNELTITIPGGVGSDELVKVSANDTTSGYLLGKIVAGSTKITITEVNDAGDEDLEIDLGTVSSDDITEGITNLFNVTHTGDVTGSAVLTIAADVVDNTNLSDMAQATIKGRANGAGTGDPQDLTATQVRTILNVEDGASADQNLFESFSDGVNTASADTATDTFTLSGGEGVDVTVTPGSDTATFNLDITGLTTEAAPDGAADFVVIYDDSASAHRKVLIDNLPSSGDMLAATYDPGGVAGDAFDADNQVYDNATSGLTATNVQAAIDEVEGRVDTLEGDSHVAVTLDAGAVTQNSANLVGQELELVLATTTTDGVLSASDKTKLDGIAVGANNYVHPNHTGDVTSIGDGAQTIAADVVDNTKLSNMPALTIKGNDTGGVADPQDLTVAEVQSLLNIEDGANDYTHPNHTGDITSIGDGATTIVADVVDNTKLANVATQTIKGRTTAGTGDPEDLTATQVRTILNVEDGASADQNLFESFSDGVNTASADTTTDTFTLTGGEGVDVIVTPGSDTATFDLDVDGLTAEASVDGAADYVVIYDGSASGHRKVLIDNFPGAGDMLAATYDPTNVAGDAFDSANHAYDNATSGLVATDVQAAIDEVDGRIDVLEGDSHVAVTLDAGAVTQDSANLSGQELELVLATTTTAGVMSGTDKTKLDGIASGANNYVHPNHTGDVTSAGDGAQTITINAVGNTKLAQMPTLTLKGNDTGGAADPQDLTVAEVQALLNIEDGATEGVVVEDEGSAVSGGPHTTINFVGTGVTAADAGSGEVTVTIPGGSDELVKVSANDTTSGYLLGKIVAGSTKITLTEINDGGDEDLEIDLGTVSSDDITEGITNLFNQTHTGEVTGSTVLTIATDVVDNTKLSNMATQTIKGRTTAGTGDPEDLTVAQVQALLNIEDGASVDQNLFESFTDGVNTASADTTTDTFTFTGGEGVDVTVTPGSDTATFDLDIDGLTVATPDGAADFVVIYDDSASGHRKVLLDNLPGSGDMLSATYDPGGVAGDAFDADNQVYDNATSGLTATDVQAAIDEVEDRVDTLEGDSHVAVTLNASSATQDSANLVGQELELEFATTTTAGVMSSTDKTKLDGISAGANNYVHPNHSGDVTSVGDGAQTIVVNVVSNTKLADMASQTLKGRSTAGTGDPQDLTATQVRTILNVANGANNYVHPNHTGDVTSVGDGATVIAVDVVDNTKLSNMATQTLKGRATAGTGDPQDLTAAQVRTILNVEDGAAADQNLFENFTDGVNTASADSTTDTFTLSSGEGVDVTVTPGSDTATFDLDVDGLTAETVLDPAADSLVVYDDSVGAHRKVTLDDLLANLPGAARYIQSGRRGNTATGSFFEGPGKVILNATTRGIPVEKGTITWIGVSRSDVSASSIEVLVNGSVVATLATAASGLVSATFSADHAEGLMSFRNISSGSTMSNVSITLATRRRP